MRLTCSLLLLALAGSMPACSSAPEILGTPTLADTGHLYGWTEQDRGWALIGLDEHGRAGVVLDEGNFDQILGPVPTPGGIAWARSKNGLWTVYQIGVSELVSRRAQGAADALSAAWALERVQAGLVPGNAADLAQLHEYARSGNWPR